MPGTRAGGLKAAAKIKAKNPNHFKQAGAIGGASRGPKGTALVDNKTLKEMTSKGGKNSKKKVEQE